MSEGLRGLVVAHGPLSTALVAAAEQISGVSGVLTAVSNSGCERGEIERRVTEAVGEAPTLVFVDMPSGSCLFAALRSLRGRESVLVITGVNLSMLVDFVFHRSLPLAEAAARAIQSGVQAIRQP